MRGKQHQTRRLTFQWLEPRSLLHGGGFDGPLFEFEPRTDFDQWTQRDRFDPEFDRANAFERDVSFSFDSLRSPRSRVDNLGFFERRDFARTFQDSIFKTATVFNRPTTTFESVHTAAATTRVQVNVVRIEVQLPRDVPRLQSLSVEVPRPSSLFASELNLKDSPPTRTGSINATNVDRVLTVIDRVSNSILTDRTSASPLTTPVRDDAGVQSSITTADIFVQPITVHQAESVRQSGISGMLAIGDEPEVTAAQKPRGTVPDGMIELPSDLLLRESLDLPLANDWHSDGIIENPLSKRSRVDYEQHDAAVTAPALVESAAEATLHPLGMLALEMHPALAQPSPVLMASIDPLALVQMFVRAGESTESIVLATMPVESRETTSPTPKTWLKWLSDPRASVIVSVSLGIAAVVTARRREKAAELVKGKNQ